MTDPTTKAINELFVQEYRPRRRALAFQFDGTEETALKIAKMFPGRFAIEFEGSSVVLRGGDLGYLRESHWLVFNMNADGTRGNMMIMADTLFQDTFEEHHGRS